MEGEKGGDGGPEGERLCDPCTERIEMCTSARHGIVFFDIPPYLSVHEMYYEVSIINPYSTIIIQMYSNS